LPDDPEFLKSLVLSQAPEFETLRLATVKDPGARVFLELYDHGLSTPELIRKLQPRWRSP
jgi:hypothetical protein